jgi:hypothetical protein
MGGHAAWVAAGTCGEVWLGGEATCCGPMATGFPCRSLSALKTGDGSTNLSRTCS